MAEAETIASFVARLGFKIDKAEEARFNDAMGKLMKTALAVQASLAAAATAIEAAVVVVAKQLDSLYFAAQRAHTTVSNIQNLGYAFQSLGIQADEVQQSIDGLYQKLIENPAGTRSVLSAIGVNADANGKLRDTKDILQDILKVLPKVGNYQVQRNFLPLLGVNERLYRVGSENYGQVEQKLKESEDANAKFGVDPERAAETANRLMTSFRRLMRDVTALTTKIVQELGPQLQPILERISKWFEEHKDDIVSALKNLTDAVQGLVADFGALLEKLAPVKDAFAWLAKQFGDETGGLKLAMEAFLTSYLIGWAARFLGIFTNLAMGLKGIPGLGWIFGGMLAAGAVGGSMGQLPGSVDEYGRPTAVQGLVPPKDPGATADQPRKTIGLVQGLKNIYGYFAGTKDAYGNDINKPGTAPVPPGTYGPADVRPGVNLNVDKNLLKAVNEAASRSEYGLRITDGLDGRPSRPGSQHPQGNALDIKLYDRKTGKEINYNDPASGEAYRQMATEVAKSYVAAGGKLTDLRWGGLFSDAKHGSPFGVQLPDWEHLDTGGKHGAPGGQIPPAWLGDKQSSLSPSGYLGGQQGRSTQFNQRTSVTVIGSSDPAGTAHLLSSSQSDVNGDLIRNMASAFG